MRATIHHCVSDVNGAGFLLPKHKDYSGQTCEGWGQLMDIGEAVRAEGEKHDA